MQLKSSQRAWIQKWMMPIGIAVFLLLLLCKFFWPFFRFGVPLGYDLGFYRYLFVRHADGFPPFLVAPMDDWAKGHPLGLFFFSSILLKLGVPVSWLLGWIWNLFPVVLASTFAWIVGKRDRKETGVLVLLTAFLSVAYFDGFAAMYWKTFASLLWCIITYRLLEKKSWWAIATGILCVATHHQTGLLFGLVFGSWLAIRLVADARRNFRAAMRIFLPYLIGGIVVCALGLLTYLPVWNGAVLVHIPELLSGDNSPGGSFPDALFFLQTEGILLAFGVIGLCLSFKKERFTLWQLSVLWCAVFVIGHLLFYRRFFLQLDFFLLPFAALAIRQFWVRFSHRVFRIILVCALLVQAAITLEIAATRAPIAAPDEIQDIAAFSADIPSDALMLGVDNESVTILRGWLPYAHVAGPGLFENTWDYDSWERFLMGTHEERVAMLSGIHRSTFLYISPYFIQYYGSSVNVFLADPCFVPTSYPRLYTVPCAQ